MRAVLRDRPLLLCIAAASLVQASNGFLYSYSTLHWTAQGLSTALISLLWVVGVASEVLFFFAAPKVLARVERAAADPDLGRDDGDPMDRAGDHSRPHRHRRPAAAAVLHAGRQQRRHHVAHRRARAGHGQDLGDRAVRAAVGRVFMFASIQLGGALYRHYAPGGFLVMALCALGAVPLLRRARAPRPAGAD